MRRGRRRWRGPGPTTHVAKPAGTAARRKQQQPRLNDGPSRRASRSPRTHLRKQMKRTTMTRSRMNATMTYPGASMQDQHRIHNHNQSHTSARHRLQDEDGNPPRERGDPSARGSEPRQPIRQRPSEPDEGAGHLEQNQHRAGPNRSAMGEGHGPRLRVPRHLRAESLRSISS